MRFSDTHRKDDYRIHLRGDLRCFRDGIRLLSRNVQVHSIDELAYEADDLASVRSFQWPTFQHHQELDNFRYEGHDCGNAVLSSLIFHTRDARVALEEHRKWIHRALETSIIVYLAAKMFNRVHRSDRVTVFNGRMATFRGVLRACQEDGVECLVHERGATINRVGLTKQTLPHDLLYRQQEILRHWPIDPAKEKSARKIGKSYFERKRAKQVFNWSVFTEPQREGLLPRGLEDTEPIYSIFTSSEYERAGLPQYFRYYLHDSQLSGILDIVKILKDNHFRGALCIRIHPNSHDEKPSLQASLSRELSDSFVKVIPADSPVDTYALIDASEKVISFGSTVSMEAAFWGKPSILLATTDFEHLDSTYRPLDRPDLVRLLTSSLLPKGKSGCFKFGHYYSTFGRSLRYSEDFGLHDLAFKGTRIRKRLFREKAIRPRTQDMGWLEVRSVKDTVAKIATHRSTTLIGKRYRS